ncbi:MAG: hypothetical protein ACUVQI_00730 [Thermochromatium sp.]
MHGFVIDARDASQSLADEQPWRVATRGDEHCTGGSEQNLVLEWVGGKGQGVAVATETG